MPTLDEYKAVAPDVFAGTSFTKTAVEAKLATVPTVPDATEPTPATKDQKIALFNDVFSYSSPRIAYEALGGAIGLARKHGLTREQVKSLVKQMAAMLALYRGE